MLIAIVVAVSGSASAASKPNILLIVADDLGFSDLGCYGGEIETPHLDRLARGGVRLTQFYTTGRCCPSRASILTGYYPHRVGLGHMTKDIGRPGYRGRVSDDVKTIAQLLNASGYRSFLSGKWHLGTSDPTKHGFEEFYGTLTSAKTHWNPDHFMRLPKRRKTRRYKEGKFYGTDALADHALDFLKQARMTPATPWFLYLAFNAPHFPLHAPAKTIAKYTQRYKRGWDVLRIERLAQMKRLGIVPKETKLSPRSRYFDWGQTTGVQNPGWKSLPDERRVDLARRMAIYAAMVDRMDQNIGRILADLKKRKELKNTLIVFTSDNGACAEWDPFGFDIKSGPKNLLHRGKQVEKMGSAGTYHSVGSGWANASNTPWRLYKHYNHEGGIAVPCIVHWPEGFKRNANAIDPIPTHLVDLVPTFLQAGQASKAPASLPGKNLLPMLRGRKLADRMLFFEHEGNRAVRNGRWKLVALRNRRWELYDISKDRTEQRDLSSKRRDIVKRMSKAWDQWAAENHVTPLPDDYGVKYVPKTTKVKVAPIGKVRKLAGGFRFTEGPAWDAKSGAWYFSDLPNKKLHRWTKEKGVELIRTGKAFSNGIVIDGQGRLVFCEVPGRRIVRRLKDGREETLADKCDGKPIGMPNDLWRTPNGGIYFTIPRTNKKRARVVPANAVNGTVCYIAPDGKTVRDVGVGLKSPNGIVGTRDGKWLYVADPGSRKCWRYSIKPDGSLAKKTVAVPRGSDGLAVDEHGNLYTTGRDEGVLIFSWEGKQIASIPVPERPANMKFGGKDRRTLFITARTGIYAVKMNVRGN